MKKGDLIWVEDDFLINQGVQASGNLWVVKHAVTPSPMFMCTSLSTGIEHAWFEYEIRDKK